MDEQGPVEDTIWVDEAVCILYENSCGQRCFSREHGTQSQVECSERVLGLNFKDQVWWCCWPALGHQRRGYVSDDIEAPYIKRVWLSRGYIKVVVVFQIFSTLDPVWGNICFNFFLRFSQEVRFYQTFLKENMGVHKASDDLSQPRSWLIIRVIEQWHSLTKTQKQNRNRNRNVAK